MARQSRDKAGSEEQGIFEKLLESPLRLIIFCLALLLISLSGGMLIGSLVKEQREPSARIVVEVPTIKPDASVGAEAVTEESPETLPSPSRPVDALRHDNPYSVSRTEEDQSAHSDKPQEGDGEKVASLPPASLEQDDDSTLPPWKRYAVKIPDVAPGTPMIAIVIDDVGLNKGRVQQLADVPEIMTLAFLPYANGLADSVRLTRDKGHEVMLHLPMEPTRKTANPGPNALLKDLGLAEIRKRTIANLDRFSGYVGVNNHMGSKFTAYEEGMAVVMDVLRDRGYLFLDSKTTSKSVGYKLAKERGMPTGIRDVFIDNAINEVAILKQLQVTEKMAVKNGLAIAIGHPHKETINALKKWMPEAVNRGIRFIPISKALVPAQRVSE